MKIIIAGSRTITDERHTLIAFRDFIGSLGDVTHVKKVIIVHGGCPTGPDAHAATFNDLFGWETVVFPADWTKYGKAAGPIRNQQMVDYSDALVAVWDGKSRGTQGIIRMAKRKGIPMWVRQVNL